MSMRHGVCVIFIIKMFHAGLCVSVCVGHSAVLYSEATHGNNNVDSSAFWTV